jgi:hypothetical protein
MKVLRIPEKHPLCYQSGFTDGETNQVLSGMCNDNNNNSSINNSRTRRLQAAENKRLELAKAKADELTGPDGKLSIYLSIYLSNSLSLSLYFPMLSTWLYL